MPATRRGPAMRKRTCRASIAVLVCAVGAVFVNQAAGSPNAQDPASPVKPGAAADGLIHAFSSLRSQASTADQAASQRLADTVAGAPTSSTVSRVDLGAARSARISGRADLAVIAPAEDKLCVFLPDPADGYGVGCAAVTDIDEGRGIVILAGGSLGNTVLVATPVTDGGVAPEVVHANGDRERLAINANVAAATLTASDRLETAAGSLDLARISKRANAVAGE
jgi:hypothetical protein